MQLDNIQESLENYIGDTTMLEDVRWLRKKIENITLEIERLKRTDTDVNVEHMGKVAQVDFSKYLETEVYNEFIKRYNREVNSIFDRILDLEKDVEETKEELTKKCCDADLKNLESVILISNIEEQFGRTSSDCT